MKVNTLASLLEVINSRSAKEIEITGSIYSPNSILLPEGVTLKGTDNGFGVLSFGNSDGLGMTKENTIENITIQSPQDKRAIYIAGTDKDLGELRLSNLSVTGQVQLLTRSTTMLANIFAINIDIVSADTRNQVEIPQKMGVVVYQGAFTIYNFNPNPESKIIATVKNISIGRKNAPVLGSGIFVSGYSPTGGKVNVNEISSEAIYSNGMLPFGLPDRITGGFFILEGVTAEKIDNYGEVVTYGVNDMVLDNWGDVTHWTAHKNLTSYGPSGIGFVNFGYVKKFSALESIETFGLGARGFNQYDGTIDDAFFKEIITNGDGSIGIQISKPVGKIEVKNKLVTKGNTGDSLILGKLVHIPANGVSIVKGGHLKELILQDGIQTLGDNVTSLDIQGVIDSFTNNGEVTALGKNSVAISK
ncbi:hypothetical protein [Flammeovirga kamogawensis]|uniref:Uncharacterized protein n=1 Tax=Flammeovirga kamogawensis TaxID=373891 RepID=A0ABX8H4G7_9BACT|nr:hypothetical protein [Flammeovirga kamogawensis]MBB6461775.1 hypothetical protein [Flammeovirga kamogawensis]QWG10691.1 hypothetical protein KM029_25240 [Flammeovirga kamogawensis]TRX63794.1 hypothetical protein EO216_25615 [Flammeovirga kamogawensis]